MQFDWITALLVADRLRRIIKDNWPMLKIIIALVSHLTTLEQDVEGVVNEIKDAPDGRSRLIGTVQALRKLADDIEKILAG